VRVGVGRVSNVQQDNNLVNFVIKGINMVILHGYYNFFKTNFRSLTFFKQSIHFSLKIAFKTNATGQIPFQSREKLRNLRQLSCTFGWPRVYNQAISLNGVQRMMFLTFLLTGSRDMLEN
jgi:hypothetical protein